MLFAWEAAHNDFSQGPMLIYIYIYIYIYINIYIYIYIYIYMAQGAGPSIVLRFQVTVG